MEAQTVNPEPATEPDNTEIPVNPVPDIRDVEGSDKLIHRMKEAETIEDWSFILGDYLSFGNAKLNDNIVIFNMGPAHDCPNLSTGHCQVSENECYAMKAEKMYNQPLPYRRRQHFLWQSLDVETFAKAFEMVLERKRNEVDILRLNESGDLRHQGDVTRVNRLAELLDIPVYLYTASDYLDFSDANEVIINASNSDVADADQRYDVVDSKEEIPDDGFYCPASETDKEVTCGDCLACMTQGGSDEIYEVLRV